MSVFLSSSSSLVLISAFTACISASFTLSGSLLVAIDSKDCSSDETLAEASRVFVWAVVETFGEACVDAELCSCDEVTVDVCVVDMGGTVAAAATVASDTGVASAVETWVVVMFAVTTVLDSSEDGEAVVTVDDGVFVAPVEIVTDCGILTVFSAVVEGLAEVMCSLEATVPAEVVTFTPSVGVDVGTVTVFAVVATLAEVIVGDGVQVGIGAAEDVSTTEAVVSCAAVVVGDVETDSVGALVVVTLVFASPGGDETVFAADAEAVATDGVVDVLSDMVGLAAGATLEPFEFESFAVVGVVVAVVGEDVEVGTGEAVGGLVAVAGVDVAVAWVKVTTAAEAFGKSFTTAVFPGTDLTLVVTAGESLTVFEITSVAAVVVVSGTDAGAALTATGDEDAVDEVVAAVVATVVVLAVLSPVVFRVVETGGFDSTGVSEAVETISVGFTTEADVSVPAGSRGVVSVMVVATVTAAAVESVTEDAEETWVDAVSGL